jgi:hypothetical protein
VHDSGRIHLEPAPVWIVVRTKANVEHRVERHLRQRRVEPYCPQYLEPPWHPRARKGPGPMFPGYLFALCRPESELSAIRYCPGVLHPLSFDGTLATVSEAVIASLREREADRGYALPDEVVHGIAAGTRVRIMEGPFRGLAGVFSGYLRGGQRAQVLLQMLRTARRIELDATSITAERPALVS